MSNQNVVPRPPHWSVETSDEIEFWLDGEVEFTKD